MIKGHRTLSAVFPWEPPQLVLLPQAPTEQQANTLELTNDELQLILSFRRCNVDRQLIALSAVEALADQTDKELTSSYTETEDSVA